METYLFYAYLKYAKENKQSFWPKLLSRPVSVIIFFSLTLLSCVCGAIFALLGWSIAALIGMVGEIVFGIMELSRYVQSKNPLNVINDNDCI